MDQRIATVTVARACEATTVRQLPKGVPPLRVLFFCGSSGLLVLVACRCASRGSADCARRIESDHPIGLTGDMNYVIALSHSLYGIGTVGVGFRGGDDHAGEHYFDGGTGGWGGS
jgi:hypothetical protein